MELYPNGIQKNSFEIYRAVLEIVFAQTDKFFESSFIDLARFGQKSEYAEKRW